MSSKIEIPMIQGQFSSRNKAEFKKVFVKIHMTRLPTINENRELKLKRYPILRKHCLKLVILLAFLMIGVSIAIYASFG